MTSEEHTAHTPQAKMVESMALVAGGSGLGAGALAAGYLEANTTLVAGIGVAIAAVGVIQHTRLQIEAKKHD